MKIEQTDARMNEPVTAPAPLASALLRLTESRRTSWHMPGHDGGFLLPEWLKASLSAMDLTELPSTDDLNRPEGPAREAMELAAAAFGAGITRFITTGSTTAVQIMLALTVGRRGRILVSRCCHQSVVHAAAMLDLDVRFLPATGYTADPLQQDHKHRLALLPQSTTADVIQAIQANPGCRAILLTSPDYYGSCANVRQIAHIAHEAGVLLIVDEAHGAHLSFCQDLLPESAMLSGADVCVQSGHKTLPVLTQGAYLHVSAAALSEGRLDRADLDRLIPVFQTSSPSFPIAATLDFARAYLVNHGDKLVRRQKEHHDRFAEALPSEWMCQPWRLKSERILHDQATRFDSAQEVTCDPLRLVLTVRDPEQVFHIKEQASRLAAAGIDIEFADLTRLVLIPSLGQPCANWQQLAENLRAPEPGVGGIGQKATAEKNRAQSARLLMLEDAWRCLLAEPPERVTSPGEALFGMDFSSGLPKASPIISDKRQSSGRSLRQVLLEESAGCIAAAAILPYPPGIPLVWPGERLDQMRVDFLRELSENRTSISGIVQGKLLVLA